VGDIDIFRSESAAAPSQGSSAVLDTSELRWFALGLPPREVVSWFSAHGVGAGTTERRSDNYQVNGLDDVGVKRRSGWTIEVKVRESVGSTMVLGSGLEAPLEEWRKWVPVNGDPLWPAPDARWVKVHKAILTRTFMFADGEVVGPASHADEKLAGCDVEIAAVTIGGVEVWSLAFEAFGPKEDHRAAILSAWNTLVTGGDPPKGLSMYLNGAAGYPEWLGLVMSQRLGNRLPRIDGAG
jgi:hypothetical protein